MESTKSKKPSIKVDQWVWGNEKIIWGFDPSHRYTFKILEPKKGRLGCLSLQYHDHKSESWLLLRGVAWGLLVVEGTVCTRIMKPGDIQNISPPMIHRLMGLSDDVQVVEPSTPDAHAADKNAKKDVIRLHCVQGREVSEPRNSAEAKVIQTCIEYTEEAISCCEKGILPPEHNRALLDAHGAFNVNA